MERCALALALAIATVPAARGTELAQTVAAIKPSVVAVGTPTWCWMPAPARGATWA
jgi:hypothetical protein